MFNCYFFVKKCLIIIIIETSVCLLKISKRNENYRFFIFYLQLGIKFRITNRNRLIFMLSFSIINVSNRLILMTFIIILNRTYVICDYLCIIMRMLELLSLPTTVQYYNMPFFLDFYRVISQYLWQNINRHRRSWY